MLVSIITLNYNGIHDTIASIRSVLNFTTLSFEYLIWDNRSLNDEASELERLFPDVIRVFKSNSNLGVAGGYNEAAKRARGKYLLFLNNDTEVTEGWINPLITILEKHSNFAACQPKVLSWYNRSHFDYSGAAGGMLDRFGYPYLRGRIFEDIEADLGQYDVATVIDWASAVCLLIRRDAWELVGGVDKRFFAYMDEVDLCWRLRSHGYQIAYVPTAVILHKVGQSMKNFPYRKRYWEHRNNLLMLTKNLSIGNLLKVLVVRLPLELVASLYYLYKRRWSYAIAVLHSFCYFLIHAPFLIVEQRNSLKSPLRNKKSIVFEYFIRGMRANADLKKAEINKAF